MNESETPNGPRFASALSTEADTSEAIGQAFRRAGEELGTRPDLAMVFVSPHHTGALEGLAADACDRLGTETLIGSTGESIVGRGREVEDGPAVSLWLASLPGATVLPMHLHLRQTPEGGTIVGWPDDLPPVWPEGTALLVLGEPFSFPADFLLERLNEDRPGLPVIGGMASSGTQPGENRLLLGRRIIEQGAVAVMIHGPVRVRTVVSQGCRPIGQHYVVTKSQRNIIEQLGGKPSMVRLQEVYRTLPTREQELVQQGLHVGRVVDEYQDRFEQGDFLVRNVIGADPDNGSIAVGDTIRPGQTVQFHIRDQHTAHDDLHRMLAAVRSAPGASTGGALLFTCNGRGRRLFSQADHDALAVQEALGDIPLAGFFAQGELGPVGGKNFVHGFTASIALFGSA